MLDRRPKSLGLLLALLALAMQLGLVAAFPRAGDLARGDNAAVLAAATICHTDDGGPGPTEPHTPDCALCPLCATVAASVFALPTGGASLPAPRLAAIPQQAAPPPATAPPTIDRRTAQPRAPPVQA